MNMYREMLDMYQEQEAEDGVARQEEKGKSGEEGRFMYVMADGGCDGGRCRGE